MTSPHRSSNAAIIVVSVSAAVVAICVVVLTVFFLSGRSQPAPPTDTLRSQMKVFDATKVADGVRTVLTSDYKLEASNVQCPDNQPVTVGSTFTCTVIVDGAQKAVQITVKSADGHFEVGQPQ